MAAILSLIVAGLAQIYNGQVLKGVAFIVVQLINAALTTLLIGWILMPVVGLWQRLASTKPPELRFNALLTENGAVVSLMPALAMAWLS